QCPMAAANMEWQVADSVAIPHSHSTSKVGSCRLQFSDILFDRCQLGDDSGRIVSACIRRSAEWTEFLFEESVHRLQPGMTARLAFLQRLPEKRLVARGECIGRSMDSIVK